MGQNVEGPAQGLFPALVQLLLDGGHSQDKVDEHRAQQSAEGGDIDGDGVQPGSHVGQGLQKHRHPEHYRRHHSHRQAAGQLQAAGQGLAAGLHHVDEGGDTGKKNGYKEQNGKQLAHRHILEYLRQADDAGTAGAGVWYPSDPRHPAPGRKCYSRPNQEQPGFPGMRQGG